MPEDITYFTCKIYRKAYLNIAHLLTCSSVKKYQATVLNRTFKISLKIELNMEAQNTENGIVYT